MFKKGWDQYFLIPYILFLFLHFIFFLPYILIRLSWYLDIDFFSSIHSKAFEKFFFSYMCCFLRNDLDVYLTIVSLWFLYVISDTIIKYRKINQLRIALPIKAAKRNWWLCALKKDLLQIKNRHQHKYFDKKLPTSFSYKNVIFCE